MIDDDLDDQEILSIALLELDPDLSCNFFPDCESAVAYFDQASAITPSYVFLDLNLPRVDSDQCLKHLARLKEFDNPTIIIYSSFLPDHVHMKYEQMGVNTFIKKTGSIQALVDEIKPLLVNS
ncbi:response regulator [Dyadobacter sandarakinus]|uniref:Response regulator n=1 Tax=Dyadobacter sandarakinus TaxID=2747268 RepID=A0ABX7I4P7_9BACT|nr:response regulator [Dyadobacter sandarakinus]QRR00198.1 response regulator [Dyadobacter sandarakinus]